jgi:hypothetical protein
MLSPTMPDSLRWSQDFALLQPLNMDTHNMLKSRRNRPHRVLAAPYSIVQVERLPGKKCLLAKLDFAMMMGRRTINFGSSRANDIAFPKAPGVEPHHFSIRFDPSTGAILLSDRSKAGTRVQAGEERLRLVRSATCVLSTGAKLIIGKGQRYQFKLKLTMPETEPETFQRLFRAYLGTLDPLVNLKGNQHKPRTLSPSSRPLEARVCHGSMQCQPGDYLSNDSHSAADEAVARDGTCTCEQGGGVNAGVLAWPVVKTGKC